MLKTFCLKIIYFKTFPLKIDDIGISTYTGCSEHFQLRKSLPKHFIKINGSMASSNEHYLIVFSKSSL